MTLETSTIQILARAMIETTVDVTRLDPVLAVGSRVVVEAGACEGVDTIVTGSTVETRTGKYNTQHVKIM